MSVITTTDELAAFCARVANGPFVTVDTEFMRESTYFPKLCLVQLAGPDEAQAIDPLANGLDLAPLLDLLRNKAVLKVFHAARQDLEIFYKLLGGELPAPLFDSQIAAMVCGFGDQASYETLVAKLAKATVDKSSRFTDWSKRPLTERQVTYALADVTHLRAIYRKLAQRLEKSGRAGWITDETAGLVDPRAYAARPEDAWLRLRPRTANPRFLGVLREIAAWREQEAQTRDLPRNRVIRDEALLEIASDTPDSVEKLARVRGLSRGLVEGSMGQGILAAVARAKALPAEALPQGRQDAQLPRGIGPLVELLKVLLKMQCDRFDVAQKLVASSADLDQIAADDNASVAALSGWRREVFGASALDLKHGRLALAAEGHKIKLIRMDAVPDAAVEAVAAES
jgi:ribonuclease D